MSDMIICEGKDFSLLEYGAGGSRLRGGWQPWGLKGFGGQASKSLEKQGCTADPEQTAEHSAQAGWACSLIPEGERNSEQQSKSHSWAKPQERRTCLNSESSSGYQEREQKRTFAEEGREAPPALRNSGGCFIPTHFTERCSKPSTSEQPQLLRRRWAETAEQLTFGVECETLIKSRISSIIWRRELQKMQEGDDGVKARKGQS